MRTPIPSLAALLVALCCAASAHAESELTFEDLRVQGGTSCNNGQYGALTFMAGDIGDKDQHVIDMSSDLGVVLGVRAVAGRIEGEIDSDKLVLSTLGVQLLIGLGYYIDIDDHMELLGGYALGVSSDTGSTALSHRDGRYSGYQGELGFYHTFGKSGIQIGVLGGYEVLKDDLKLQSGDVIKVKASGFTAAGAIGYRF